jgi:hypothetical protein
MTNLQMKKIESKSKTNFYSCEVAMEEIRVGVQELTAEKIKTIYQEQVLTDYANTVGLKDETNLKIREEVVKLLMQEMGGLNEAETAPVILNNIESVDTVFTDYLSPNPVIGTRTVTIGKLSSTSEAITIHNVNIIYVNEGYRTSITSDIRINLPLFNFTGEDTPVENIRMEQPYKNFALVADGEIRSENFTGTSTINGDVYAGGKEDPDHSSVVNGISVISKDIGDTHHSLIMNGDNIITRGNITITNTAQLTIKGNTTKAILWADNLITNTNNLYPSNSTKKTTFDMEGICFIKDDLVLNGRNSEAKLSGAYVGYTGKHTVKGSAIMVNGSGSRLDLTGLSDLILAGRSHIDVDNTKADQGSDTDILTGESLGFKSNQRAYLIPDRFIGGIFHNPVTEADIGTPPTLPLVTIVEDGTGIDYQQYVPVGKLYKIAAKQSGIGGMATTLRYYYLNFTNGKKADDFLRDFMLKQPGKLNELSPFELDYIKLPVTSGPDSVRIASVGNLMYYELNGAQKEVKQKEGLSSSLEFADDISDTPLDEYISSLQLSGTIYNDTAIKAGINYSVGMLSTLFSRISHLLSLEDADKIYDESDEAVKYTTVESGVAQISSLDIETLKNNSEFFEEYRKETGYFEWNKSDPNWQAFVLVDGDVTIDTNSKFHGILIATGKIVIKQGASVNGLVVSLGDGGTHKDIVLEDSVIVNGRLITGGDIMLGNNCFIQTDAAMETQLADIFNKDAVILSKLFKNVDYSVNVSTSSEISNFVDLSNMIIYENWRKDQ